MKRKLFGTDGIRGKANHFPMTAEVALKLGQALGHVVKKGALGRPKPGHRQRIVIGKDTRLSRYVFECGGRGHLLYGCGRDDGRAVAHPRYRVCTTHAC